METYWQGEPCEARRVRVVVADNPEVPRYWARPYVGQIRDAVEVTYLRQTFYLDDEGYFAEAPSRQGGHGRREGQIGYAGWGWHKVTTGRGSPSYGHASLTIEAVTEERI